MLIYYQKWLVRKIVDYIFYICLRLFFNIKFGLFWGKYFVQILQRWRDDREKGDSSNNSKKEMWRFGIFVYVNRS